MLDFFCKTDKISIMSSRLIFLGLLLSGCASVWNIPSEFTTDIISSGQYDILTYQKLTDLDSAVHIYIEGDGHAFDRVGRPTNNPTPRGTFMRDLVARDNNPNVIYMARPCQYIMSESCQQSDWTSGRFSQFIIDSMSGAIKQIVSDMPVVLIGYSGGAMVSGLVILRNSDIKVKKWITIAGVLNHSDWTEYFGDAPLTKSLDMVELPHVNQLHYIAREDEVVPNSLSMKWLKDKEVILLDDSSHSKFSNITPDFTY